MRPTCVHPGPHSCVHPGPHSWVPHSGPSLLGPPRPSLLGLSLREGGRALAQLNLIVKSIDLQPPTYVGLASVGLEVRVCLQRALPLNAIPALLVSLLGRRAVLLADGGRGRADVGREPVLPGGRLHRDELELEDQRRAAWPIPSGGGLKQKLHRVGPNCGPTLGL
jgi:hypothetical protein